MIIWNLKKRRDIKELAQETNYGTNGTFLHFHSVIDEMLYYKYCKKKQKKNK